MLIVLTCFYHLTLARIRCFATFGRTGGGGGCDALGVSKRSVVELSGKDQQIALAEYSRLVVQGVRKKRYSLLCLVFQSACVDFFETCHNCRLKNGKKDECKINAFVLLSNIDKAICVETYFSTKCFGQTRRLLIKKLGWNHRKSRLAPNNATAHG